jgi:hypothetical protein
MKHEIDAVYELAQSAALARFRILRVEGEEHPDRSWQRVTGHIHREDLPWATIPIIYAVAALSFSDARPRGASGVHYIEKDEWRIADMVLGLHLEAVGLVFDADYVRGRMMKTTVTVGANGKLVVETRNRHEMASRWLQALKGNKHIRLAEPSAAERPRTE